VCTPTGSASRATLFTGRLPRQHGIHDFLTPNPIEKPPQGQAAPPPSFKDEIMISDLLAAQGYRCGYVGKWHMGNDQQPQHQFNFWYTMLGGSSPYQNPTMSWNGQLVEEKGYLADLMTSKACQFLDQQSAERPFFLTVSHFNPHTPYEGHPQKYYDMYANTSFQSIGWDPPAINALREKNYLGDMVGNLRKTAAATTALDDQIPALLNKLRERKLYEQTLVIFCGDNGYLLGRHGLWSKGLASDPINMYDEVMRVPMLWSWPGKIPPETVRPELVSFYDVLPSICEATGTALPSGRSFGGRSYWSLAAALPFPKKTPWRNVVYGHFRNTEMVRDTRYKLVLRNQGEGPNEFYAVGTDRREKTNLYENPQYVSVRDELTADLTAWRKKYS
jgi:arylsulfatase A-like enzyme